MGQQAKPQPLSVDRAETISFTLRDLLFYFLRLGTFGFGGPIALAGYMQRDLVEECHWVSKSDYLEGLAFSQLSPGPLAAQLAMYIGWLRAGFIGATLVGIAFFADGQVRASYTAANRLGAGRVSDFQFDDDGTLWVSTEGGLTRLKNNHVATLSSKNGLPCDTVHWAMEEDDRSLWLYT